MIVCWVSNRNPPLLFRQSNLASLDFGYREFHYNFSPKSHWCQWPESCESPLSWCSLVADCFREKLEDCRSRLKLHDSWIPKWGLKSKLLKFQNQSCDIPSKSSAFCRVFVRGPVHNLEVKCCCHFVWLPSWAKAATSVLILFLVLEILNHFDMLLL